MGTNADPCEILTRSGASRISEQQGLHMFVITKLPPINQNKLNSFHSELTDAISKASLNPATKDCKIRLLTPLFEILKKERPLFVNKIVAHLKTTFCTNSAEFIDLKKLCSNLRKSFLAFKKPTLRDNKIQYVKSQINLLMRDEWLLAERPKFLSVAVNSHIAHLRRPKNLHDNCEGISTSEDYFPLYYVSYKTLVYQLKPPKNRPNYEAEFEDFVPFSEMPGFREEPLACLTFTGGLDDTNTFFRTDETSYKQASAMFALQQYIKVATNTSSCRKFNGRKLEFLAGMSSVLASRAANVSFYNFVRRLAYHLTLEGNEWTL